MKYRIILLTAASLLAFPLAASAQPRVCPPGEALGNPDCVRPGVARNMHDRRSERRENIQHPRAHRFVVGQILDKDFKDFREVTDFQRLGLPRPNANVAYWQVGDRIVAVDRHSREVLRVFNPG